MTAIFETPQQQLSNAALEEDSGSWPQHMGKHLSPWIVPVQRLDGRVVPVLGIRAFKFEQVWPLKAGEIALRFQSSGTSGLSGGLRATHALCSEGLAHYAKAATQGYCEFLRWVGFGETATLVSLVPSPKDWPQSSLSHMLALIESSGHPVTWATPEGLLAALESLKAGSRATRKVVVFGTSLHHHLVSEQHFCKPGQGRFEPFDLELVVVDTGGAKGHTTVLDPQAMAALLGRSYGALVKSAPLVASEYGMCELLSQAWSLPGDLRTFRCSPTLEAFVVDPHTLRELPPGQMGLLAFIDRARPGQPIALLTEDLGHMEESETAPTFTLVGRAPTASLKGCSLRVSGWIAHGASDNLTTDSLHEDPEKKASTPLGFHDLRTATSLLSYSSAERDALAEAWASWQPLPRAADHVPTRRLLIICSANTPITPLFPIFSAWDNGFREVIIKMPSNRDDDPLAALIREQISELLSCLKESFESTSLSLGEHTGELSASLLASFDDVIVFGTDATVEALRRLCPKSATLHGFGDLLNTLELSPESSPEEIAALCLAWRGRGCLTPRALVSTRPSPLSSCEMSSLLQALDERAREAFAPAGELGRFYHWHDLLHTRALLLRLGVSKDALNKRIHQGEVAAVVDVTGLEAEATAECLPLEFAGQGLVFLVDADQVAHFESFHRINIRSDNPLPGYADLHQGLSWQALLAHP